MRSKPSAASRPRVGRFGVYYEPSYVNFVGDAQRQFAEQFSGEPLQGPLDVHCAIRAKKPKTSKLAYPRFDVDNAYKGVGDAATKAGVWEDDTQVVRLTVTKEWAKDPSEEGATLIIRNFGEYFAV